MSNTTNLFQQQLDNRILVLDGAMVCSCLVMAADADGAEVTTVEGLAVEGSLHPVQEAMLAHGAVQCGFCTPGMIMATKGRMAPENDTPAVARPMAWPRLTINQLLTDVLATIPP